MCHVLLNLDQVAYIATMLLVLLASILILLLLMVFVNALLDGLSINYVLPFMDVLIQLTTLMVLKVASFVIQIVLILLLLMDSVYAKMDIS